MQQRVAIARALANQPRVLLMDEPFGALDAQTRSVMQDSLLELRERIDATVVFVTHDIDEAILLADRVLIMSAGPGRILRDLGVDLPRPAVQRHHARSRLPRAEEGLSRPDPVRRPSRLRPVERRLEPFQSEVDTVRVKEDASNRKSSPFRSITEGSYGALRPWHEF